MTPLFSVAGMFFGHRVVVCGQIRELVLYEGLMADCPYRVLCLFVDSLDIEDGKIILYTRRVISRG